MTRARKNPCPYVRVQVFTGTGVGCPKKPQGSLSHSLLDFSRMFFWLDPVRFDLKFWPYHCHSDSKKFWSESTRIRPNLSGSAQIRWVTGKTSQKAGINLADFLKYVFKPNTQWVFDWKWQGFFQHQETVKEIFSYWTTTDYNQTTRTFIRDWVISHAKLIVGQELKAISYAKILHKTSMVVNEDYFLDY